MATTKFLFALELSEDGLWHEVYTNIKSLYNGIVKTGYNCTIIEGYENEKLYEVPFTYNNLVKEVRKNQERNRVCSCTVSNGHSQITVSELVMKSK